MKIIVASKNPVKMNACKQAFETVFKNELWEVEGVAAASGVADQPISNNETLQGALNRSVCAEKEHPGAAYYVGIEGGVEMKSAEMESFAWIVVRSSGGKMGKARTASFFLPPAVVALIRQGKELGEADDIVFKRVNSSQKDGAVGLLTNGVISRTEFFVTALVLALIPFAHGELYTAAQE